MERLLVALLIAAAAVAVAVVAERRRRPQAPTGVTHEAPGQLDRGDFGAPSEELLIVLFSSSSCASCAAARAELQPLVSSGVALREVEEHAERELHRRYRVTGIPTVVVVDAEGVTKASWLGPPPKGEVATRLAALIGSD
jgi:hypothetical protein